MNLFAFLVVLGMVGSTIAVPADPKLTQAPVVVDEMCPYQRQCIEDCERVDPRYATQCKSFCELLPCSADSDSDGDNYTRLARRRANCTSHAHCAQGSLCINGKCYKKASDFCFSKCWSLLVSPPFFTVCMLGCEHAVSS